MNIGSFFSGLAGLFNKAFHFAKSNGLTAEVMQLATDGVRVALHSFEDNAARREWVVAMLVQKGVPESIARLAVEVAVQLLKREKAAQA